MPPCSRRYPGWEKKTLEGYPSGSLCKPCLVQKLEKININRIYKVCSHHLLYKLNNQPMVLIIHNIHIYHMAILGFCWWPSRRNHGTCGPRFGNPLPPTECMWSTEVDLNSKGSHAQTAQKSWVSSWTNIWIWIDMNAFGRISCMCGGMIIPFPVLTSIFS